MAGFTRSATFGVVGTAAGLMLGAGVQQAKADIVGISTTTFQANSPACCSGVPPAINNSTGTVTAQDTNGSYHGVYQGGSIFDTTPQNVSNGFTASFTFTAPDHSVAREGLVFALENDPAGAGAIGDTNEGINFSAHGYPGSQFIQNSTGLIIDFNTNKVGIEDQQASSGPAADTIGSQLVGSDSNPFVFGGDTVNATLAYNSATDKLLVNLTDTTTGITASTTFTDSLPYITGTGTYVGFGIGDGAGSASPAANSISNFTFTAVPEPAGLSVAVLGGAVLMRRRRRRA